GRRPLRIVADVPRRRACARRGGRRACRPRCRRARAGAPRIVATARGRPRGARPVAILVPVMGWVVSARVLDPAAEPAYSSASDRMARDDDPPEATTIEPQPGPAPRLRTVAIPETPTPAPDPEPIEIEDAIDDAPPAERATSPRGKPAAPGPGKAERLRTLDA